MTIKAIETEYKGYRFRSRLEARWAVFFDALPIPWEYEKQGFDIYGTWYLPDFWLPSLELWFEIKGQHPTKEEINLVRQLSWHHYATAIAWGLPGENLIEVFCHDSTDSSGGSSEYRDCEWCFRSGYRLRCSDKNSQRSFLNAHWDHFPGLMGSRDWSVVSPELISAFDAARSARFEHGESGAQR